ncbi:uncharacterized protein LOC141648837 [Silene latifolia]|uniref:uncharacterized protein LOC141648837 n=1 Tax=Silene latifolia TaxID=37657 RepID=UPI003D77A92A
MNSKSVKCPVFDGTDYGWWKNRMMHFIQGTDYECWVIIENGPLAITTTNANGVSSAKAPKDYTSDDYKKAEKNARAISLLQSGIGESETSRIAGCKTAKQIWDSLSLAYEGTVQVKKQRIDLLMQQYENFRMHEDEPIKSMSSRFSSITNELSNLGRQFETEDIVRKILRSLTRKWRQKVTAIEECRDLATLTYEALMGSLMAHEITLDNDAEEKPKAKGLALNAVSSDNENDLEEEVALLSKRIAKIIRKQNQGKFESYKPKKSVSSSSSSRSTSRMGCFKCGERDHQIRNCPKWEEEKAKDKREKSKQEYKRAMIAAVWGESDSEDEEPSENEKEEKFCLRSTYKPRSQRRRDDDSLRCLMAHSDASDSESEDEVYLSNLKIKIRSLSKEKIVRLLDETLDTSYEQNKRLEAIQSEIESIAEENIELRRNLKNIQKQTVDQTVQSDLTAENESLVNKIHVLTNELDEIKKLHTTSSTSYSEICSKFDRLNNDYNSLLAKNKNLLVVVNNLETDLSNARNVVAKWEDRRFSISSLSGSPMKVNTPPDCSIQTDAITVEIKRSKPIERDFRKPKYVGLPEYTICKFCGHTGHGHMRGGSRWYLDSGCSRHMTGNRNQFLSLSAYDGGNVTFGDNKKGEVIGIGKVGKSLSHSIDDVLLVKGLKHNLISISQLCDKGNKVEFHANLCYVIKESTNEIVLQGKRVNNIYVADLGSIPRETIKCLSVLQNDPNLWHKRFGHVGFSSLNKLYKLDLVEGLPSMKFEIDGVCDVCARCKHVRSSFKSKRVVSTTKPLELIHMDLCGPMRIRSRGGSLYVCVLVDDYSRFVWTLFLHAKSETFEEFLVLIKKLQNKLGHKLISIRTDHGREFENDSFISFCREHGIDHNFSAPRTPQQNGVVERMNRTLEDMTRSMLLCSELPRNFWASREHTCYIRNRVAIRSIHKKTPYELLYGRKPNISHFRCFGSKCYVHNNGKNNLGKFDPRSDEAVFIGYSNESKAYKVYNKRTMCFEESVHVIFDETNVLNAELQDDDDFEIGFIRDDPPELEENPSSLEGTVRKSPRIRGK